MSKMNYDELLQKRNSLLQEADDVMSIYIEIADKMYHKRTGTYAGLINMDVNYDGIEYEYYIDSFDYSAGKDYFYVSKEKLESLVDNYLRKEKLKKLKTL